MDWIRKNDLDMSSGTHALYLDLLSKVNGIDSAEKYFISLPDPAKDHRTYGAIFYCYCRKRMQTKAIALYKKMKELNLPCNIFVYNNLMSLYMKLGHHKKVTDLFQDMKASNVSPDNCSYRILMKSYASKNEIESVERALQDMEGGQVPLDWFTYCCLAEIYISVGLFGKAEIALKKAELVMGGRDLSPFPFLIKLYAEARNLIEVKKVWKMLKARTLKPKNELYLFMLQALRKLGDMDGLEQCFKEWKPSYVHYDTEKLHKVIDSHLGKNTVEEIKSLQEQFVEEAAGSDLQDD